MKTFSKKKTVQQNTLGSRLKKIREEKKVSLQEVEDATKVQKKYLEAIENGDYQNLPGDIYVKAWIKKYADFLEIDSQDFIVDYKIEKDISNKILGKKNTGTSFGLKKDIWPASKIMRYIAAIVVVVSLVTYLALEVRNIISPPEVEIYFPESNYRTIENNIEISGKTESEAILNINNEQVLLEDDGSFKEKINLVVGLNNLQISVKKKHSQTKIVELIIYRESLE